MTTPLNLPVDPWDAGMPNPMTPNGYDPTKAEQIIERYKQQVVAK